MASRSLAVVPLMFSVDFWWLGTFGESQRIWRVSFFNQPVDREI
jgi:hypothetical protein